jgi:hypothetical protein
MQTTASRGMRYILASTDAYTSRLFRRYGFKVFATMPTEGGGTSEYLCYLEVGGEDFVRVMGELANASAQVVRQ